MFIARQFNDVTADLKITQCNFERKGPHSEDESWGEWGGIMKMINIAGGGGKRMMYEADEQVELYT